MNSMEFQDVAAEEFVGGNETMSRHTLLSLIGCFSSPKQSGDLTIRSEGTVRGFGRCFDHPGVVHGAVAASKAAHHAVARQLLEAEAAAGYG